MELFTNIFNFIIHIDVHLGEIIIHYGSLSYILLFIIIFSETGLIVTPFLPGDSLLFVAGAFSAISSLNIIILLFSLWIAAFLGDSVNYYIGHYFGQKIIDNPKIPINQKHLDKAQQFYEKHGGKAIILSRFMPIIRTFAPFVAGIGKMNYKKFIFYNAIGGFLWIFGFTLLGYFFGNIPSVKKNFSFVIIIIIILSFVPILIELIKAKFKKRSSQHNT